MTGRQKTTLLILFSVVVLVFIALCQLLQGNLPALRRSTASPPVVYTPTSTPTATSTASALATAIPLVSETAAPAGTATPTPEPTNTHARTPTPTETLEPTATSAATEPLPPTLTPTARPVIPAEIIEYLDELVELVGQVHNMKLLAGTTQIDQSTVDAIRGIYRSLHEMEVPEGAEEMHLAFIIYVSVLEEKCLCHVFAQIHSADGQGQHYRECEARAMNVAMDIFSSRFIPNRESFLQRYGLNALELGFPY